MTKRAFRVLGRNTPKVDAIDKVTGQAKFGADVKLPGTLSGKVLRSPHAHARITSIDTARAKALPGVRAVITSRDFPSHPGMADLTAAPTSKEGCLRDEVMAGERVRFHGHAVAAVAAVSNEIAEEALGLIEVAYEALPHVLDVEEAMRSGAASVLDGADARSAAGGPKAGNVAEHLEMGRGDVDRGFAEADVVVERSFKTQVVHQGYIEPESEAAYAHADGTVEVWANTQATYAQRADLALLLQIPLGRIKVIPTEVGGAFGGKETVRLTALCAALSQKAGLPVRITLSREEVLRATGPGNATVSTVKIGARNDGTITAIQARIVYDAGAYPGAPLRSAIRRVFSHYRTANLKIDAFDVLTNKPHVAAYRAPGATPTAFALESVIDEVGEALAMDAVEFRLKNVSRPGDPMPDGVVLPSVNLAELLQRIRRHRCWSSPIRGPDRGRGVALGMWTMPGGTTSCHVILNGDGSVTLVLGTVDLSATRTSLAMVAAESLGLDLDDVRVVIGDTDMVAHSDASAGDKVTYVTSKAVDAACLDLLGKLKRSVARQFNVPHEDVVYERKGFWVEGAPEMSSTLEEVAQESLRDGGAVMGVGSVSETFSDVAIAPNAAAHVVDVEVDRETGKVRILSYTAFQDVGFAINPGQIEGQMQGGVAQGIGWALSEEYDFDESGVLLNASLLDYRMQTSTDLPLIDANIVEIPSEDHPLGIRAVGQVPIVPPAAAIANAVFHAVGVRMAELPMKPERVWKALSADRRQDGAS